MFISLPPHMDSISSLRRLNCPPPPRLVQNFFIFMQLSRKIGQIIGWRPAPELVPLLWEILDPPLISWQNNISQEKFQKYLEKISLSVSNKWDMCLISVLSDNKYNHCSLADEEKAYRKYLSTALRLARFYKDTSNKNKPPLKSIFNFNMLSAILDGSHYGRFLK